MTNDFPREGIDRLRARANESLQRFARNKQAIASSSLTSGRRGLGRRALSGLSRSSPLPADGNEPPVTGALVDDERQVRAMAKEIKRLIVEDRRRGLGIGG